MCKILKHHPFTLLCVVAIWYLSLSHPPSTPLDGVGGMDKVAHFLMYGGTCSVFWWEHLRHGSGDMRSVWWWAILLPVVMGGIVELAQNCLTETRSGDWWDFAANSLGVIFAAALAALCKSRIQRSRDIHDTHDTTDARHNR